MSTQYVVERPRVWYTKLGAIMYVQSSHYAQCMGANTATSMRLPRLMVIFLPLQTTSLSVQVPLGEQRGFTRDLDLHAQTTCEKRLRLSSWKRLCDTRHFFSTERAPSGSHALLRTRYGGAYSSVRAVSTAPVSDAQNTVTKMHTSSDSVSKMFGAKGMLIELASTELIGTLDEIPQ